MEEEKVRLLAEEKTLSESDSANYFGKSELESDSYLKEYCDENNIEIIDDPEGINIWDDWKNHEEK